MRAKIDYGDKTKYLSQVKDWNEDGRSFWSKYALFAIIERAGFSSYLYVGNDNLVTTAEVNLIIEKLLEQLRLDIISDVHE